jgi:putative flippase GtrA
VKPASGSPPAATTDGATTLARQARGYLVVGGLAAVVDIGLFHLLAPRFAHPLLPAVASFLVAACFNYTLSAAWVYRRDWRSWGRAARFLMFALVGLCINAGVTWWLLTLLPLPPAAAKVGGVGVAFVANFLMNTFLVFRSADAAP